ncbi:MAG TPA: energy-coupled thiamine transporter ThiT [Tissierellaceae bacterium]
MNNNKSVNVRMLVEGGIMIALAMVLSQFPIYQAPQGGSVTAGSMVPIMIFAIRWGVTPGIGVGALYGLLHFIFKPYFLNFAQFLFDYIIPFGALGLAGLVSNFVKKGHKNAYFAIILSSTIAVLIRMASHVASGAIFFKEYAGAQNPWIYSIIYNGTYLIPELILTIIVLVLIWKPIQNSGIND